MSVDIEALIASFLRGQLPVTDIVTDRVYTDIPHKPIYPLVVVNRTGGGSLYKNFLESAEVDVHAFGGTHKLAYTLANTCVVSLAGMVGSHPDGVVTKVKVSAVAYDPEPDSQDPQGHARPRFTVNATVTAHPA